MKLEVKRDYSMNQRYIEAIHIQYLYYFCLMVYLLRGE